MMGELAVLLAVLVVFALAVYHSEITGNAINLTINDSACIDFDGGKNYSVYGKTCLEKSCISDSCQPDGLQEMYCESNEMYSEIYTCPIACEYGRCATRENERIIVNCSDSDGKDNFLVKGYVQILYDNNATEKVTDSCNIISGEQGYWARDYFCIETGNNTYDYSYNLKKCTCENNACIEEVENESIEEIIIPAEKKEGKIFFREKEYGEYCQSNYACKSNMCINNICSSRNIFVKISIWLNGLF